MILQRHASEGAAIATLSAAVSRSYRNGVVVRSEPWADDDGEEEYPSSLEGAPIRQGSSSLPPAISSATVDVVPSAAEAAAATSSPPPRLRRWTRPQCRWRPQSDVDLEGLLDGGNRHAAREEPRIPPSERLRNCLRRSAPAHAPTSQPAPPHLHRRRSQRRRRRAPPRAAPPRRLRRRQAQCGRGPPSRRRASPRLARSSARRGGAAPPPPDAPSAAAGRTECEAAAVAGGAGAAAAAAVEDEAADERRPQRHPRRRGASSRSAVGPSMALSSRLPAHSGGARRVRPQSEPRRHSRTAFAPRHRPGRRRRSRRSRRSRRRRRRHWRRSCAEADALLSGRSVGADRFAGSIVAAVGARSTDGVARRPPTALAAAAATLPAAAGGGRRRGGGSGGRRRAAAAGGT